MKLIVTRRKRGAFEGIMAIAGPQLRPLVKSLRRQIASLHKEYVELVWPRLKIASYGVGPHKLTEHYAYIAVYNSHINLGFYHGAALADPAGMLEGTGKKLRHLKLRDAAAVKSPAVVALLREAIADRRRFANSAKASARTDRQ